MATMTTATATKTTAATLTKALRAAGYSERVRQGRGYVYLTDGEADGWFTASIGVCYASDLTAESIVTYRNLLANDRRNY